MDAHTYNSLFFGILLILGVVCLYFLPSWVAGYRQHRNFNAIFVLNILLGWSVLGWIIAFVWAFTANTDDFSPRLKPGVSWVRTKQETPNALPTPLAPPFLPIAKARGISEDLDEQDDTATLSL